MISSRLVFCLKNWGLRKEKRSIRHSNRQLTTIRTAVLSVENSGGERSKIKRLELAGKRLEFRRLRGTGNEQGSGIFYAK